jgi:hypothetical protein
MATLPPPHSNLSESWRDLYIAAILELDKAKLLPRITQAEIAISERSSELFDEDGVNAEEKEALQDALCFLQALRSTLRFEKSASLYPGSDGEQKVA